MIVRVLVRADASSTIGYGHVSRCLTLADALQRQGVEVVFACREQPGDAKQHFASKPFDAMFFSLPTASSEDHERVWPRELQERDAKILSQHFGMGFDVVIVDHYGLDWHWERCARALAPQLVVIDDLANRTHECDLLVDSGLGRTPGDYSSLWSGSAPLRLLLGPRYALIREEFSVYRDRPSTPERPTELLISMGGGDQFDITSQVLRVLIGSGVLSRLKLRPTVVLPANSPWVGHVRDMLMSFAAPSVLLVGTERMAPLMAQSHAAIGAGGMTALERCCMGLPSILVVRASNQENNARALDKLGAALVIDGAQPNSIAELPRKLEMLIEEKCRLSIRKACLSLFDPFGAYRVAQELVYGDEKPFFSRPAMKSDEMLLFTWANDSLTRKNAFNPEPISLDNHKRWFARTLDAKHEASIFLIEDRDASPIGQVRLEVDIDEVGEVFWKLDYSVAPELRGKGFAKPMLQAGLEAFFKGVPEARVIGYVKSHNFASSKTLLGVGFSAERQLEGAVIEYHYKKHGG